MSTTPSSLAALLQRPDLWRGDALAQAAQEGVSSGFAELDAALPGRGWPRGTLTELLPQKMGLGEVSLLVPALAGLEAEAGWIVLVAPPWLPHAPAWQAVGLGRLLVVRADKCEAAWACEQLLASGALAALIAWLPQADSPALRRLQLALEGRPSLAFVFRPAAAAGHASPAALRLALAAGERSLAVHILKRRGPPLARPLSLAVPRPLAWTRLGGYATPAAAAPADIPQPA